jgi:hypothetical protein
MAQGSGSHGAILTSWARIDADVHAQRVEATLELRPDLGRATVNRPRGVHGGPRMIALVKDDDEAVARRLGSPDNTRDRHSRRVDDRNVQRALDMERSRISHMATMDTPPDHS